MSCNIISDRVLVMYLGRVVEIGPVDAIFERPQHPYTRALLASRPSMDPTRRIEEPPITGDPPNPIDPPSGCRFHTRCPFAEDGVPNATDPALGNWRGPQSHVAACHMHDPLSGHSRGGASGMSCEPLAEVRDLTSRFVEPRGHGARGERRQLHGAAGRGAVHPRRIRLGQERHPARADAPAAAARAPDRGRVRVDGHDVLAMRGARCATCAAAWSR